MPYRLVLFDADGTLWDFHRAESQALRTTFADFGLDYSPELHGSIYHEVNAAIWKEFERGELTQESLAAERFRRFFSRLDARGALSRPSTTIDVDAFGRGYLTHLGEGAYLIPGAEDLVARLRASCRMAVITNGFAQVQRARFSRTKIVAHFDAVFISSEIGSQKPDAAFFEPVFRRFSEISKSDMLVVGDSLSSDIQGGINVGLDTCWYNPSGARNETHIVPTSEIRCLDALDEIVLA